MILKYKSTNYIPRLQTCQNYGATIILSGQSGTSGWDAYVRLLGALVLCETLETCNTKVL